MEHHSVCCANIKQIIAGISSSTLMIVAVFHAIFFTQILGELQNKIVIGQYLLHVENKNEMPCLIKDLGQIL